jgi:hypothetical protein
MPTKLNAEWHREHRMPPKATLAQRVEWHLEHQKQCACRDMPASVKTELARRESMVASRGRRA